MKPQGTLGVCARARSTPGTRGRGRGPSTGKSPPELKFKLQVTFAVQSDVPQPLACRSSMGRSKPARAPPRAAQPSRQGTNPRTCGKSRQDGCQRQTASSIASCDSMAPGTYRHTPVLLQSASEPATHRHLPRYSSPTDTVPSPSLRRSESRAAGGSLRRISLHDCEIA